MWGWGHWGALGVLRCGAGDIGGTGMWGWGGASTGMWGWGHWGALGVLRCGAGDIGGTRSTEMWGWGHWGHWDVGLGEMGALG